VEKINKIMLLHPALGVHERNGIEIDVCIGYRMDVFWGKDVFHGISSCLAFII
jgi:hypothetical protein